MTTWPFRSWTNFDAGDYADYQEQIAEEHLLPLLRRHGLAGSVPVLDVGCGEGGFTLALASVLSDRVVGVDVNAQDIAVARRLADRRESDVKFRIADLLTDPLPDGPFGLILLRDVVEHLSDIGIALGRLRESIDERGVLYAAFPPWRGPYAGHQHHASSALKYVPYLHALAPGLFLRLAHRLEAENEDWLADERQIVANRLTMPRFENLAAASGWRIDHRRTYLLRPALARYGLPSLSNGFLGRIPVVGEMVTTGVEYLLEPT